MIFSSQRLPRSRCLTHSAAVAWPATLDWPSARFAALGFMERAAGHLAILDQNRKVDQSFRGRMVFQGEDVARPNRVEKFSGADMPMLKINSAREFDGLEHLIEQYCPGQQCKCREVARKRGVVCRDLKHAVHFHCDSLIRSWLSAKPCSAC